MPLATLAPYTQPPARPDHLTRTQAASRLGINGPALDKMISAGMLTPPIAAEAIERLRGREQLQLTAGELTVLRTDARACSLPERYPHDDREWIGFHVEHTDDELEAASLRWWRCSPARVIDNVLLVVTVATFPVALYQVTGEVERIVRPDENVPRYHFSGRLLARVSAGMAPTFNRQTPGHLQPRVKQIMNSRITVTSGGPIGYLEPSPKA